MTQTFERVKRGHTFTYKGAEEPDHYKKLQYLHEN